MRNLRFAALLVVAACGPETTSFRTTDQGDGKERTGPPAAAYVVRLGGREVANVHVSSNGGYIGSSGEPMTHIGFDIRNTATTPIVFESDALRLVVIDKHGAPLRPTAFTAVTPLGPAQVPIAAGATAALDAYFWLPVRPRVVETMRVQWALTSGDDRYDQTTSFVRDDDYPVTEPPPPPVDEGRLTQRAR